MKGYVQVYRNLHKTLPTGVSVYSVRGDDGLVKRHTRGIILEDCSFRVGKKGRERVLKERRKNVHAYIQGKVCPWDKVSLDFNNYIRVTYDPYKHKTFVNEDTGEPIHFARFVMINGRRVKACL